MPVPRNHPNLCVRRVCNTGLGAGKSLPVKYTPQTAYRRTHLEKMYQIQTIKKDCTHFGVAGNPPNRFHGLSWHRRTCVDARRKACVHADDFRQSSVAIATVFVADDRRCCTLTRVPAQRSSQHTSDESAAWHLQNRAH